MKYEDVILEKKDMVGWLTLNRPERLNSFDFKMSGEVASAMEELSLDEKIGVVVITGAGRAFSAGGYLADLQSFNKPKARLLFQNAMRMMLSIRSCPKPVIAAVNGFALGGGNELVVWCDLAIASDKAKFGQTGPRIGSAPVAGGTNGLTLFIGEKMAKEVCFLCRQYDAHEAQSMGWINKVVPHERLYEEVDIWCQELLDKAPTYLEIAKMSCNTWFDMLYPSFTAGMGMLTLVAGCPEMIEGASAFMQKRKPDFRKFRSEAPSL